MFTLQIGSIAPDFTLPGSDGIDHSFHGANSVRGQNGTLIFFTCNHCPYVIGSEARMKALYERITPQGVAMVAIHSNETQNHPTDTFPLVLERMKEMGFQWLSLKDEKQFSARDYGAQRTPHYFLFNAEGVLVYSGRMDDAPRDASKAGTHELQDAIDDLLAGVPVRMPQTDAIGCNIKWWDMDAHWMPGDACDLDYLHDKFPKAAQKG
jgi:peroxiredoxin